MATLGLPGYGFGIRYEYGMFYQKIEKGFQVEHLEHWLRYGNPWEFPRPERLYPVRFGGSVVEYRERDGRLRYDWRAAEQVMAMAYDTPIPGFGTETVNNMRLWSAKATREMDLRSFNEGNYIRAVQEKIHSENLTRVLYPSDTTAMGRELRFEQEYFFVSASIQDILVRYLKQHQTLDELPDHVAIQLNDTHPALAIPELMRIMLDEHGLDWDRAWAISTRVFSYTNHTLLPEALETWPVSFFESTLPRHLQIVYQINHRFLTDVRHRYPGDADLARRVSLIDESDGRRVRMSHLALVGSHAVNGVSALHTDLMRRTLFADFERLFPGRITNITNGITPRRWLNEANPRLAALIASRTSCALGHRSRLPARPRAAGRRRRLPAGVPRRQARQQGAVRRPGPPAPRPGHRPGVALRRADQAHPRVQAPAAEPARRDRALQPHPRQPRRATSCRAR